MAQSLAFYLTLGATLAFVLYGCYVVLFVMAMAYLMKREHAHRTPTNKLIALSGILIFGLITAQTVIACMTTLEPFLISEKNVPGGDAVDIINASYHPKIVAFLAMYFIELAIFNFLMIYRLWVVWQRNRVIAVLPLLAILASMACESLFIVGNDHPFDATTSVGQKFGGVKWLTIGLSCDVFLNMYCTALLSFKIWQAQRATRGVTKYLRSFSSYNVMAIIIESAAIYTVCIFTVLVTYACENLGSYVVRAVSCPIAGICYCLVIIRFGMGGAFKKSPQLSTFAIPSLEHGRLRREENFAMHQMEVNVNLQHHTDLSDTLNQSSMDFETKDSETSKV